VLFLKTTIRGIPHSLNNLAALPGEVPGPLAPEELEKELKSLDAVKAEAGAQDVTNYHLFVQRVQQVKVNK
jgi:hypothetical protein